MDKPYAGYNPCTPTQHYILRHNTRAVSGTDPYTQSDLAALAAYDQQRRPRVIQKASDGRWECQKCGAKWAGGLGDGCPACEDLS